MKRGLDILTIADTLRDFYLVICRGHVFWIFKYDCNGKNATIRRLQCSNVIQKMVIRLKFYICTSESSLRSYLVSWNLDTTFRWILGYLHGVIPESTILVIYNVCGIKTSKM